MFIRLRLSKNLAHIVHDELFARRIQSHFNAVIAVYQ